MSKQILTGMHYIHANKILHRDMKVANVLMSSKGVSVAFVFVYFGLYCSIAPKLCPSPPSVGMVGIVWTSRKGVYSGRIIPKASHCKPASVLHGCCQRITIRMFIGPL